jgi:tetratricopeptide (TPR) repeat protein
MNEIFKRILDSLVVADLWDEIFKRTLDLLKGPDLLIALLFLAIGIISCVWIGTTKKDEKKVLGRQVTVGLGLVLLAGAVMWVYHASFDREPVFSKDLTGILVMPIVGDDSGKVQGELVETLNVELQKDPAGKQIEVHEGRENIDENNGLAAAHERARAIGRALNAKLVIWGRKIGDKNFYPRITVVNASKAFSVASERTDDAQKIDELRLPDELVDEPFYLIHFAAGYSYYDKNDLKEALPHFEAALRRHAGLPYEIADLQFFSATCVSELAAGQKDMAAKLEKAIGLYEKAAKAYEETDQKKWAKTKNNVGVAYAQLPTGERAANLRRAISAYEAALEVITEKDFSLNWAQGQTNLGNAYRDMSTGDQAANLQKAIALYEAALRVCTEKDFPLNWALIQTNLGDAYVQLSN